jgi:hypothetical protein
MTFMPLLGVSEVVRRFLMEKSPDRSITMMTLDDVEHYSEEEKARIIASYPAQELEARTRAPRSLAAAASSPLQRTASPSTSARYPTIGRA